MDNILTIWDNLSFTWWSLGAVYPLPWLIQLLFGQAKPEQTKPIYMPFYRQLTQAATSTRRRSPIRSILLVIAWSAFVISITRPVYYGEPISIPNEGRDLMVAVDLSGSMQTQDMQVNGQEVDRLVMVKTVLGDFIQRRIGDRIGLILFADTAYLQAPLTFDRTTVEQLLSETVIGLVGDSTAIGDAIGLAAKRFTDKPNVNKVLILLTDGQNTAGNITPDQALTLAVDQQIKIYPIGVGADSMVVNSLFGQRQVNPSADLDESLLTRLAKDTGGQYFRARDTDELQQIYRILDKIEPVEDNQQTLRPQHALFYWALLVALGAIAVLSIVNWANRQFNWRVEV